MRAQAAAARSGRWLAGESLPGLLSSCLEDFLLLVVRLVTVQNCTSHAQIDSCE